jgi:3-oxoacyl-[acyl-carrier-protein] synthase-3
MEAAVPRQRSNFADEVPAEDRAEIEKVAALIGVDERRVAPDGITTADMCLAAAETLLAKLGWERDSIDALVYVTQGPDYLLPATACILQQRLGLPMSCAAFDLSLGCSGYVYGVWVASQLLAGSTSGRALVLVGDISTRHVLPGDRSTGPLFGDAGSATALERDPAAGPMYIVSGTDGGGARHISIKAGRERNPLLHALKRDPAENESLFADGHLHLNGPEVFSFTLRTVPKLLAETLEHAGMTIDDIDMCVMHQANHFILEHLRKKTKVPAEKFLVDMREFGNTSSASIPLAICHSMGDTLAAKAQRMMLVGFGVGWSWAALVTDIGPIPRPGVTELGEHVEVLSLGL